MAKQRAIRIIGASLGAAQGAWSRRAGGMELSVRLVRWEMKSMPSELMAPHVLIAMMTRRIFGPMSPYWLRRE
jgi:hypothetical protein